jgi:transcriptional regulator with XRE-family HTH domain
MTYGEQIREARMSAKLTQAQAGQLLGYCRSSIQKYETGRCVPPPRSRQWILKILNASKP